MRMKLNFDLFSSQSSKTPRKILSKPISSSPPPLPIELSREEYEQNSCYNESDSSNSTLLAQLPSSIPYRSYPTTRPSYFNSGIEAAMKQRLDIDDEPIPFIDDNLSTAPSRKSSATCWSDKTSLSSRLSLIWKLNQKRSKTINGKDKRRSNHQHRNMKYSIPPIQQNEQL